MNDEGDEGRFEAISSPEDSDCVDRVDEDDPSVGDNNVDIVDRLLFDVDAFNGSSRQPPSSTASPIGIAMTTSITTDYNQAFETRSNAIGSNGCSLDSVLNTSATNSSGVSTYHRRLYTEMPYGSTGELGLYCDRLIDTSRLSNSLTWKLT